MKKIAVLGNMNNNFVALIRYLRDAGYEATLFYIPAADHFRPIADSFDPDQKYFIEVNWLENTFFGIDELKVRDELKDFDFFIGQGTEAFIAKKCGINIDLYFPYGSDFYKYAWLPQRYTFVQVCYMILVKKIPIRELKKRITQSLYTKQTIKEAKNVWLDITNPEYEQKLLDIGLEGSFRHVPMPFIYLPQYQNRKEWDVHWKSHIENIRSQHDFVLVYHGRHEWELSKQYELNTFTTKNTHHLIIGFAKFKLSNPNAKIALVTLEYGGDVTNSKKLISELDIENSVFWFPKMYRKDLMYLLNNADLGSGEFDKSYLTFGTIIEAMVMGKPVIHYREDSLYSNQYPELYPLYNAREPEEIAQALQDAYDNPEERIAKGKLAQAWVKSYFIEQPLGEIYKLIKSY
jgi:glycosyltransferase involved in cell wall biosynthesis